MLTDYLKRDNSYQLIRDFYDKNCQEGNIEEIKNFFKSQEISEKKLKYVDLMEGIYCSIKQVNPKLLDYLLLNIPIGEEELFRIINDFRPDIVSLEEIPEYFMDDNITKKLYDSNRT